MSLKIKASGIAEAWWMKLHEDFLEYSVSAAFSNAKRFPYREIEYLFLSDDFKLCFQVGHQVFSMPVKPYKEKHKEFIDALVKALESSP